MVKNLTALLLLPLFAFAQWTMDFDEMFASASESSWTPAALNPVYWFRFDGNVDNSGSAGSVGTNVLATYVAGVNGQSLSFDGATSYFLSPCQEQTNITVCFWYKPRSTTVASVFALRTWSASADPPELAFFANYTAGNSWLYWNGSYRVGMPLVTNQWDHISQTYAGGVFTAYQNGFYVGTFTGVRAWGRLRMLVGTNAGASGLFYKGEIDDIMIFGRVLTTNELALIRDWRQ